MNYYFVYRMLLLASMAAAVLTLSDTRRLRHESPTEQKPLIDLVSQSQRQPQDGIGIDQRNHFHQNRRFRHLIRNDSQARDHENPSTMGSITALMVRVIDSKNVQPDKSVQALRDEVFFDESSLKTQFEACSYHQLEIEPFSGTTSTGHTIHGGVTDISIDYDTALGEDENDSDLTSASLDAAYAQIGDLDSDTFDIIMFCLPPDPNSRAGFSQFENTKYSFVSNDKCSSVSTLMMVVGHTLGLASSRTIFDENDRSGAMGSRLSDDVVKRCFNPAKNYQLGWYQDQVLSIDPLTYTTDNHEAPVFILNGVPDYKKNSEALVVLKLVQTGQDRAFYVGYNRATGVNADTPVDQNKVTIHQTNHENGSPYGSSTTLASLYPGQSYIIPNFNGEPGRDVEIRFVELWEERVVIEVVDINNHPHIDREIIPAAPCSEYSIEIKTDNYPGDVYWTITENRAPGHPLFTSPMYTDQNSITTQTVCLPDRDDGVRYRFQIYDAYGDGIPGGYYMGYGPGGDLLFEVDEPFSYREHLFDAVGCDEKNNKNRIGGGIRGTVLYRGDTGPDQYKSAIARE